MDRLNSQLVDGVVVVFILRRQYNSAFVTCLMSFREFKSN